MKRLSLPLVLLAAAACFDRSSTAPRATRVAVSATPSLQRRATDGPTFTLTAIRGVLVPPTGVPIEEVASFVGGSAVLTFSVTLVQSVEQFTISLAATNAAGDTIFRGTQTFSATADGPPPAVSVPLVYVAPDAGVTTLLVDPRDAPLSSGADLQMSVTGTLANGSPVANPSVGWTSRSPAVATVSAAGVVHAVATSADVAWIVATTFRGVRDSTRVFVRAAVASVVISPRPSTIGLGGTADLAATVKDAQGVTLTDRAVAWSSLDPTLASVSSTGHVTALALGVARIQASAEGVSDQISITVTKGAVTIAWPAPAAITYGTPLGATQLDASASAAGQAVAGSFAYTPGPGAILNAGTGQTLSVTFTPTDGARFAPAAATTQIDVLKAPQTITFGPLPAHRLGEPDFAVTATSSAGLLVTFTGSGGCDIIGVATVHLRAVGPCTIIANQAGDANHTAAPAVTQSFTVLGLATTLTVSPDGAPSGSRLGLRAVLTSGSTPVPGRTITFSLFGTVVGTGTTDASGLATVDTVQVGDLAVGTYTAAITASFAGDVYAAATGSADLVILSGVLPPGIYGNYVDLQGTSNHQSNVLLGGKITITQATTIGTLGVLGRTAGPHVQLALYTSDANGNVGTLVVGTSGADVLVAGRLEIPVTPTLVSAGTYWIVGIYDVNASIGIRFGNSNDLVEYVNLTFGSPLPRVFPTPTTYTGQAFNYWVRGNP